LITGGVVGAQMGTYAALRLRGEQLRLFFAVLTLLIAADLLYGLLHTPADVYSTVIGAQ
jgi:uncharacterized protein